MATEPSSLPAPFGRYVLEHRLATGGMAEIFLARQEGPGGFSRELVIKRILPHFAGEAGFVEMFLDEAKLAALLAHPNIVPIFDFGEVDGAWFLAMELVRGPDLRSVLEAGRELGQSLPFQIQARIIADAALGLEHAHRLKSPDGTALNIIHRDISPSNIIVSFDGVTKLLDFGIAKADQASHKTSTGFIKGKFAYMPPEQIEGSRLDPRADVYALGVVLFELATGRLPFAGESDFKLMRTICEVAPPSPRELAKDVPEPLEEIILRALSKDREDRFPSARAMAADLERFAIAHSGPVSAFDVAETLAELRTTYAKPLDVLARAGLTGGSGLRPKSPAAGDAEEALGLENEATRLRPAQREKSQEAEQARPDQREVATLFMQAVSPKSVAAPPVDPSPDPSGPAQSEVATVFMQAVSPRSVAAPPVDPSPDPSGPAQREVATVFMQAVSPKSVSPAPAGDDSLDQSGDPSLAGGFQEDDESSIDAPPAAGEALGGKKGISPGLIAGGAAISLALVVALILWSLPGEPDVGPRPLVPPSSSPTEAAQVAPAESRGESVDAVAEADAPNESKPEADLDAIPDGDGAPSVDAAQTTDGDGEDTLAEAAPADTSEEPGAASAAASPPEREERLPAPTRTPERTPIGGESRPPARAATGFVMVQSLPWSEIVHEDRVLGTTPLRVELPAGRRELLLRNPEAGLERRVVVQVRSGQTARVSESLGEGRVAVLVRPYGEVWVGEERRGITPMPPLVLPAGRHTIEVVHPESDRRSSHTVTVVHGETQTLRVDLTE